jgi:hypothetical protein
MMIGMGPDRDDTGIPIRIVASTDLARAGLERLARAVSGTEVGLDEGAIIELADDAPPVEPIRVRIGQQRVTIRISRTPTAEEWSTLSRLVDALALDDGGAGATP